MVVHVVAVCLPVRQLVPVSSQNALIRELEHTKKLIEESHHEKVSGPLKYELIIPLCLLAFCNVFYNGGYRLCISTN